MSDIVERLRLLAAVDNCQASIEAADEITRLRAEAENQVQWVRDLADNLITEEAKTAALRARVAELEEALRVVFQPGGWTHGDDCRCEACCRARAALAKTGEK